MDVVKPRAIEALLASDAVMRSPPTVRDWLSSLLIRGEGATAEKSVEQQMQKDSQVLNEEFSRER